MKGTRYPATWFAIVVVAGCGAGGEKTVPPASAEPVVVRLSSTEYAFDAPDSIAAGWTSFHFANNGTDVHYAHIVRLDSGKTVTDLVSAYAEAIRTSGPRPKWVTRFGGPGGAAPGSGTAEDTQFLEPGNYVWICPIEDDKGTPHFGKGEVKPFVVHGATGDRQAGAPTATSEIRLMDFTFTIDSTLRAGTHTVHVVNAGVEPHDLVLLKLAEGRTIDDVRRSMNPEQARRDQSAEPPLPFESLGAPAGGIAAIAPGYEVFTDLNLTPGDYVAVCMATAPDGRSHIEHGMIKTFRIE